METNLLSEKELRRDYIERTCTCGSDVSKDHHCFTGFKHGLTFLQWIASNGDRVSPFKLDEKEIIYN